MSGDIIFWLIPISAIVASFAYSIVRTVMQTRVRELELRERIAMIERGLVPPPEKDPHGFERGMDAYDRYREGHDWDAWHGRSPRRYRSGGIVMLGIGFGLMMLIGLTSGETSVALGVGGFLVAMGLAFIVNGWLDRGRSRAGYYGPSPGPTGYGQRGSQPPSFGANEPPRSS